MFTLYSYIRHDWWESSLGSPVIPYTTDKDSSKSLQSNPETLARQVDSYNEPKTCAIAIVYVGGQGGSKMWEYDDVRYKE